MIEAVVQAGTVEISYCRAGAGPAVILLATEIPRETADWLFGALATRFRVIVPTPPTERQGDPHCWLRGLIDGLGLGCPALVAATDGGAEVLRFAALDPHRVSRVALVHSALNGGQVRTPFEPGDISKAPHPVLLVGLPGPDEGDGQREALDHLARFLAPGPTEGQTAAAFSLS